MEQDDHLNALLYRLRADEAEAAQHALKYVTLQGFSTSTEETRKGVAMELRSQVDEVLAPHDAYVIAPRTIVVQLAPMPKYVNKTPIEFSLQVWAIHLRHLRSLRFHVDRRRERSRSDDLNVL